LVSLAAFQRRGDQRLQDAVLANGPGQLFQVLLFDRRARLPWISLKIVDRDLQNALALRPRLLAGRDQCIQPFS
jgi:hypothetical protein